MGQNINGNGQNTLKYTVNVLRLNVTHMVL